MPRPRAVHLAAKVQWGGLGMGTGDIDRGQRGRRVALKSWLWFKFHVRLRVSVRFRYGFGTVSGTASLRFRPCFVRFRPCFVTISVRVSTVFRSGTEIRFTPLWACLPGRGRNLCLHVAAPASLWAASGGCTCACAALLSANPPESRWSWLYIGHWRASMAGPSYSPPPKKLKSKLLVLWCARCF
jgi:hypothetical protein